MSLSVYRWQRRWRLTRSKIILDRELGTLEADGLSIDDAHALAEKLAAQPHEFETFWTIETGPTFAPLGRHYGDLHTKHLYDQFFGPWDCRHPIERIMTRQIKSGAPVTFINGSEITRINQGHQS